MRIETRKVDKKTHIITSYDSLTEIDLATPTQSYNVSKWDSLMEDERGTDWYGMPTRTSAGVVMDLFRHGWTDGVSKLQKEAHDFSLIAPMTMNKIERPRQRCAAEGDTVDVQAMLTGDFDHMWHGMERRTMEDLKTRVHIVTVIGGDHTVKAEQLKWSGILAAVLGAKALENGYDVKITAVYYSQGQLEDKRREFNIGLMNIKRYDESLSLANLAPLMSPAYFRAVCFKGMLLSPEECASGLGQPRDFTKEIAADVMGTGFADGTPLWIPPLRSREATLERYKQLVEELQS